MATHPNPRTWVDGEIPPYSTINAEVYSTVAWLLQPPTCKIRQVVAQSLPNATFTALTFTQEDVDPYNWHNSTSNNTRITPTFPGWYRGWFGVGFSTATGGNFRIGFARQNGSEPARSRRDSKPTTVGQTKVMRGIPFYMKFNGTTDYAEIMAFQDTGSAMNTSVSSVYHQAEFFLRWWAPL